MKGKAIVEHIRKGNIVRTDNLVSSSIRTHVMRRLSEEKKRLVAEQFALLEGDDDEDGFDDDDFDDGDDEIEEGLKPSDRSGKTRKAADKKVTRMAGKKIKEATLTENFKVLKTTSTHKAFGQLIMQMSEDPVGYIPRVKSIPSPYASSPTDIVYEWNGHNVFTREVSHKVHKVFEVPADMVIYKSEDEAEKAHGPSLYGEREKLGLPQQA